MSLEVELCGRVTIMLLRHHMAQISSSIHSGELQGLIRQLSQLLKTKVGHYRETLGTNLAGLRFIDRSVKRRQEDSDVQLEMKNMNNLLLKDLQRNSLDSIGNSHNKKQKNGKKIQTKRRKKSSSLTMSQVTGEGMEEDED